jgi:hypothetical protein
MAQENERIPELRHEDEEMLRHYLLGDFSEVTRRQIDERLFTDNDYFQHLLLVEEELVDDYVGGSLSADEGEKFGRLFLTVPERVENVAFARAIGGHLEERREKDAPAVIRDEPRRLGDDPRRTRAPWKYIQSFLPGTRPAFAWPLLVALVLAVIGASWLLLQISRRAAPSGSLRAEKTLPPEQPSRQMTPPAGEQQSAGTQPSPPVPEHAPTPEVRQPEVAQGSKTTDEARPTDSTKRPRRTPVQSVFLATGLVRGEGDATLIRVPGDGSIVFKLALMGDVRPRYRAVLMKGEREVRSWPAAGAVSNRSGKFVPLAASVKNLPEGSYFILLSVAAPDAERQEVGRYYFRLAKD